MSGRKRKTGPRQPNGHDDNPVVGFDGAEIFLRERLIPGTRQTQRTIIRNAPGTFEWRYARYESPHIGAILYVAGTDLAKLWERAGSSPSGVDLTSEGVSQWRGLPDGRAMAMLEISDATRSIGKLSMARLVNYAVQGMTTRQISVIYQMPIRKTAHMLEDDLNLAAHYFGYLRGLDIATKPART